MATPRYIVRAFVLSTAPVARAGQPMGIFGFGKSSVQSAAKAAPATIFDREFLLKLPKDFYLFFKLYLENAQI